MMLADAFVIDQLLQAAFLDLLSGDYRSLQRCKSLIARLSAHQQRTFLYSVIRILPRKHLQRGDPSQQSKHKGQSKAVGGIASLLRAIVGDVPTLQDNLVEWLVGVSAEAVGQVHDVHRAVIAALSSIPGLYLESALQFWNSLISPPELVTKALQKGLTLFGDKLYIKHTPVLHQEGWTSEI